METTFVETEELECKIRSKKDLYDLFKYNMNYHLPSYRRCSVDFLKSLMKGSKKAFKMSELQIQNIPSFNELSTKKMWEHFKGNSTVKEYFPEYKEGEYPERDYFFAILNTLYSQGVDKLVDAAYKARKVHFKKQEDDMIQLTNEMKEEIKNVVVYKTTSGRALCMLKAGTLNKRTLKERISFPADLSRFAFPQRRRVRRLVPPSGRSSNISYRQPDVMMEEETKEEEKEDSDS